MVRKNGIQLLRVVMMLWVIAFHFADHGAIDMETAPFNSSWLVMAFCRAGGGDS